MGCQKEIARDIVDGGGDFVLAVKDNQPRLSEAIRALAASTWRGLQGPQHRAHETEEARARPVGRAGRLPAQVPADFAGKEEWPWVKAVGYAVRVTLTLTAARRTRCATTCSAATWAASALGRRCGATGAIESMHWVLDVTFREDDSRTRERVLANNLSWLRRFAVTLLKRHPIKDSIRGKMIRCLMNTRVPRRSPDFQAV